MNIIQLANQIQEELDKRSVSLDQLSDTLSLRVDALNDLKSQLDSRESALIDRENQVKEKEAVILSAENTEERTRQLRDAESKASVSITEATKREKELGEMLATVKQREEAVAKRESAVSEREESYKEVLQQEFFEGIKRNLPQ